MQRRDYHIEVIDDATARMLRAMGGEKRLQVASDMYASARRMLIHHLHHEHPDWDEYRSVMVSDRRVLLVITVDHVYGERIG